MMSCFAQDPSEENAESFAYACHWIGNDTTVLGQKYPPSAIAWLHRPHGDTRAINANPVSSLLSTAIMIDYSNGLRRRSWNHGAKTLLVAYAAATHIRYVRGASPRAVGHLSRSNRQDAVHFACLCFRPCWLCCCCHSIPIPSSPVPSRRHRQQVQVCA